MAVCLLDTWFLPLLHDKISLSTYRLGIQWVWNRLEGEKNGVHSLRVKVWTALEVQPACVDVKSTKCCVHLWRNKVFILQVYRKWCNEHAQWDCLTGWTTHTQSFLPQLTSSLSSTNESEISYPWPLSIRSCNTCNNFITFSLENDQNISQCHEVFVSSSLVQIPVYNKTATATNHIMEQTTNSQLRDSHISPQSFWQWPPTFLVHAGLLLEGQSCQVRSPLVGHREPAGNANKYRYYIATQHRY